jgi:hypothetical protein
VQKYQLSDSAETFVDALLQTVQQALGVDLSSTRDDLLRSYSSGSNREQSRAATIRALADDATFKQSQYNAAFVLTEYFGYLRRDPDESGYNFWLHVLNGQHDGYRGMVCSFVTSTEYQQRFSSVVTHHNSECVR